jgi:hypothetical protein
MCADVQPHGSSRQLIEEEGSRNLFYALQIDRYLEKCCGP